MCLPDSVCVCVCVCLGESVCVRALSETVFALYCIAFLVPHPPDETTTHSQPQSEPKLSMKNLNPVWAGEQTSAPH